MLRFMQARRRAGLSEESMLILLCVRWAGAASRLDLAAECAINPTTLPRYTATLVRSGHLVKTSSPGDGREVLFGLSVFGASVLETLIEQLTLPAAP